MDKKEIQAGLLLLGTFVLGLITGAGGVLWLSPRADHRPLPHERPGPPPGADETARLLPDLPPEKREEIENVLRQTRRSAREQLGEIRSALQAHTDAFVEAVGEAAPGADLRELTDRTEDIFESGRRGIPPPPHFREEALAWLGEQDLTREQRRAVEDALDGYLQHYWDAFRSMMELSATKRREARERIGAELTDEQRRALRERFRERREERRRPPPPPPPPTRHDAWR